MSLFALVPYALAAYGGYKGYRASKDAGGSPLQRLLAGATGAFLGYQGGKMVPNCVPVTKAAMGRAAFSETTSKAPGTKEQYNGSYIKSEIDGQRISNKSYEKYYKGMI